MPVVFQSTSYLLQRLLKLAPWPSHWGTVLQPQRWLSSATPGLEQRCSGVNPKKTTPTYTGVKEADNKHRTKKVCFWNLRPIGLQVGFIAGTSNKCSCIKLQWYIVLPMDRHQLLPYLLLTTAAFHQKEKPKWRNTKLTRTPELCHPQPSTAPPHSRPLPPWLQELHVELGRGTGTQTCTAVTTLRASPCNLPQQGEVCTQLEPRELKSRPAWDVDEAKALGCILKTHPKPPHITSFPTVLFKVEQQDYETRKVPKEHKHSSAASSSLFHIENPEAFSLPVAGLVTRQSFCTLLLRGHAAAVNHKKTHGNNEMPQSCFSKNTHIVLEPHNASDQLNMASPKPEFIHMHTSDKRADIRNCCLPQEIRRPKLSLLQTTSLFSHSTTSTKILSLTNVFSIESADKLAVHNRVQEVKITSKRSLKISLVRQTSSELGKSTHRNLLIFHLTDRGSPVTSWDSNQGSTDIYILGSPVITLHANCSLLHTNNTSCNKISSLTAKRMSYSPPRYLASCRFCVTPGFRHTATDAYVKQVLLSKHPPVHRSPDFSSIPPPAEITTYIRPLKPQLPNLVKRVKRRTTGSAPQCAIETTKSVEVFLSSQWLCQPHRRLCLLMISRYTITAFLTKKLQLLLWTANIICQTIIMHKSASPQNTKDICELLKLTPDFTSQKPNRNKMCSLQNRSKAAIEARPSLCPLRGPWTGKVEESFKTVCTKEISNPMFSDVPNHNFRGTENKIQADLCTAIHNGNNLLATTLPILTM
ncbi:hypothetical protein EK904_009931 [Melospiza melodia maxima]|nr:hypothetical protein EK904_009931 [Melospiza melodia maxima]